MRQQIGFTLIELMIALVVLAVLAVVGAPAMSSFFEKRRVTDAAMAVYSQLQLARSTAIARSEDITFVVSGAGSAWQAGFTDNATCDLSITAEAVQQKIDDGDADPWADACSIGIDTDLDGDMEADEREMHRISAADFAGTTFTATANGWSLEFDSMRGVIDSTVVDEDNDIYPTVTFTSDGDAAYQLTVRVLPLGQVKICSPNMPGYGGC